MRFHHALPISIALVVLAVAVGCNSPTTPSAAANAKTVTLEITGMTCADGCAPHVQETIAKHKGVSNVEVDFVAKRAKFTVAKDGGYDEKAVLDAIKKEGFEAKVIQ